MRRGDSGKYCFSFPRCAHTITGNNVVMCYHGLALSKYGKGPGAGALMGDADLIPGHSAVLGVFQELELLGLGLQVEFPSS